MKTTCVLLVLPLLLILPNCSGSKHQPQQRRSTNEILKIDGIQVYNNVTKHLLAFVNRSSDTAIVFDYFTTNLALFNGQTGRTILVGLNGTELIENSTELVWSANNSNFETFYNDLQSIPNVENTDNTSDELLNEIRQITNNFGLPNDNRILETLRTVAKQLNANRDIIKVFLSRSGFPLFISHGISRFTRIIGGLGRMFLDGIGGFVSIIPTLIRGVNHIDFHDVMNSSSGFEAFCRILQQFSHHLDFPQTIHRIVNDNRHFFHVVRHFGDDTNNVDNFFRISNHLLNVRNGNLQIDEFIRNFINLQGNLRCGANDIRPHIRVLRDVCDAQNATFHNAEQLQNFRRIIDGFNNNNLKVDGVDIAHLLHLLGEGDFSTSLQLLIKTILRFNELFNPFVTIPRVIGHFISKSLNNASTDLPTILQNGNFMELLQHNSEISDVYKQIRNSVQQYGNGAYNLDHILLTPNNILPIHNFNWNGVLSAANSDSNNLQNPTTDNVENLQRSRLHYKKQHQQHHQQRIKKQRRIHRKQ